MKTLLAAILVLSISTMATAQTKKMSPPKNTLAPNVLTSNSDSVYNKPSNEIMGHLGMVAGAFNLGVTYVKPKGDYGFGGYLFMQSSKDKNNKTVVSSVTAFGALLKVNLVENHNIRAFVAPGFGMAMIKEGSISSTGSKSDENIISPIFKMGVQYKFSSTTAVGLERMQFANWLNDNLNNYAGPADYYTVVASFEF
jgi:hypothetical protein